MNKNYTLKDLKGEWLRGLITGSIITFIVVYLWFKYFK